MRQPMDLHSNIEIAKNFDDYKNALQSHSQYITDLKQKVSAIVSARQLTPIMNDTKWLELQGAINGLPFPPPYIVKCITDKNDFSIGKLDEVPNYIGDWSSYYEEGLPPFFNIEWIKVCPRYGKHRGHLLDKEILDETSQFTCILEKYFIPYEEQDNMFIIYGYR